MPVARITTRTEKTVMFRPHFSAISETAAYDDNGYLPFKAPVSLMAKKWDLNITVFSVLVVILAAGTLATGI